MSQSIKPIGKIAKAQGIKGEVFVYLLAKEAAWLDGLETMFLCLKDWAAYKVERARFHKQGLIVKLEGIDTRNQAEELKNVEVGIDPELLVSAEGESIYLEEVLGFKVIDKSLGDIGVIEEFSSNGAQDLLVISKDKKRWEVPFVDEFIVDIDWDKKSINLDLPEGLLSDED
jgi:16S rRNA processing protein RimM